MKGAFLPKTLNDCDGKTSSIPKQPFEMHIFTLKRI